MTVHTLTQQIEAIAPIPLQEIWDNSGLLVGDREMEISGVLICIDVTEEVVLEALEKNCNFILSHHPLIFGDFKNLTGQNEVQRCIITAIKNDIAIYAAHTNMDNILDGVSGRMADKIGLINRRILQPKKNSLLKIAVFVPKFHVTSVRQAMFEAGAGQIGNYDSCSYNTEGYGTFRANEWATPFVGEANQLHTEPEIRIEVIVPAYLKSKVVGAMMLSHPYEEPAYDIIPLQNNWNEIGAGIVGDLENAENETDFLIRLKNEFGLSVLKHTRLLGKKIKRVALCGGAGSAFLRDAKAVKADIYISGDFKYHEFFEADNQILIADIGHFESEQFTKDIFYEIITKKMPTFAVQISDIKTNPINYL